MANLTVNNRPLEAAQVYQLRPSQVLAAREASKKGTADDVFFVMGRDTFVASGRAMELRDVKPGDPIEYQGRKGQVVAVEDHVNSAKDGFRKGMKIGGAVLGTGTAASGSMIAAAAGFATSGFAVGGMILGAGTLVLLPVAVGAPALFGAVRQVDTEAMKAFAE